MSPKKLMVVMLGAALLFALGCGDSDNTATGGACAADSECAEGKCHAGICVAATPVDKDATCTNKGECKSLLCTNGKCVDGATVKDAVCLNSEECASGNCENGKCSLKVNGKDCADDKECKGGACVDKKCFTTCAKAADCTNGEVCHSKDMKKTFCMKPTYDTDNGKKCGVDGKCGGATKCYGRAYDAGAWCGATCTKDTDCPPNQACGKDATNGSICRPRGFCSPCANDGFCPNGFKCASMHGAKYCTKACTKGGTDCGMFGECKDDSNGNPICMHKGGKCIGDGTDCAPCKHDGDCKTGATCFNLNLSFEQFCSTDCTSGGSCANGTSCMTVNKTTGAKSCIPSSKGSPPWYTCTTGITHPLYKVGDIFPDFEMVGLIDKDKDGTLTDETLTTTKLSDLSGDYKAILFNIMTFW